MTSPRKRRLKAWLMMSPLLAIFAVIGVGIIASGGLAPVAFGVVMLGAIALFVKGMDSL